jgi:hypothetical protein
LYICIIISVSAGFILKCLIFCPFIIGRETPLSYVEATNTYQFQKKLRLFT